MKNKLKSNIVQSSYQDSSGDLSLWILIISNILTVIFAVVEQWSLISFLAVYWAQSIIIGSFNVIRILISKNDMETGGKIPNFAVSLFFAGFFLAHYGIFHIVYAFFIFSGALVASKTFELWNILPIVGLFFANHLFSFIYNFKEDMEKRNNLAKLMFFPYARIIPMHLTILFGGLFIAFAPNSFAIAGIAFFVFLKTIADAIMHYIEHHSVKKL